MSFDIGYATEESVGAIAEMGLLVNGTEESQGNGSIMRFHHLIFVRRMRKIRLK